MNHRLILPTISLALLATACAASFRLDGTEAVYVDAPSAYERHPRYAYRGTYVYEIEGQYYRQHENRWVRYHGRPGDLPRERER